MKKKTKKLIGIFIGFGVALAGVGVTIYEYIGYQMNNEGSDLWYDHAPLEEIKAYREKLGIQFRDAGINNLNDSEYDRLYWKLNKVDNIIAKRENDIYIKEHPNAQRVSHSNGWYLESDD